MRLAEARRVVALIDTFTSHIIANPIWGSGFSYFLDSQEEKLQGLGNHNFYTTIFAQGGLLIFIPLVFILAFLYFSSRNILSRNVFADPASKDMGMVLNAGLIAYLIDLNFPRDFSITIGFGSVLRRHGQETVKWNIKIHMKKITFIISEARLHEQLSIMALSASLKNAGHETSLVFFQNDPLNRDRIVKEIKKKILIS